MLDLRDNKNIDFQLTNAHFFNNTGNVILEKVGSLGIKYTLNNLTFNDNALTGEDASMGILHLDFARSLIVDQVSLGDLTFVNNMAGNKTVGLSVSGNLLYTMRLSFRYLRLRDISLLLYIINGCCHSPFWF